MWRWWFFPCVGLTDGMVSGVRLVEPNTRVVQISAPISPGSSGGPVLNALGEVIGVATFGIPSGEALGFAVPVEYVRGMLKRRVSMPVAKLGALAKSRHAVWQDTDPAEGDAPSPPAASAAPPPPPNR